jgi:hypothetical protein
MTIKYKLLGLAAGITVISVALAAVDLGTIAMMGMFGAGIVFGEAMRTE